MRLSPDLRWTTLFLLAVVALAVVAAVTIAGGRAYVDAVHHIEALAVPDVHADVSSTIDGAQRGAGLTALRLRERVASVNAERETARRQLDTVERAATLLGVLAVVVTALAYVLLLRGQRTLRRLRDEIANLSTHDATTGLPNARFFTEWLSYAIAHARRERGHVAVLFIDISGCPAVSEFHGEQASDTLLVEVARRFRTAAHEGDLFARLGATAFALATPNAHDGRELALLAQRLRDQLNEPALPPLADTPVGASIGIAYFPEDANDSAGIMAAANVAMYAARRAGKNHVAFNALAA
jgi:diguanylate cyclase (GGDEF)-like protein